MTISRKRWLRDAGAAAAGVVAGVYARGWLEASPEVRPSKGPAVPPVQVGTKPPSPLPAPAPKSEVNESYSQCGEDLAIAFALGYLQLGPVTYLDVGANDPVKFSNTYYFYLKGNRGVLVEPNPALCTRLIATRPRDTVLQAGIGPGGASRGDYYVMTHDGLNTFSKEEAEHRVRASKGSVEIKQVISMPLLDINEVMDTNFRGAPTFLSIDTEGLDLAILRSIDYKRFRPPVICAETLMPDSRRLRTEILEFMATVGYTPRGGSLVNTIFIDNKFQT